jgi:hypothetical protein
MKAGICCSILLCIMSLSAMVAHKGMKRRERENAAAAARSPITGTTRFGEPKYGLPAQV